MTLYSLAYIPIMSSHLLFSNKKLQEYTDLGIYDLVVSIHVRAMFNVYKYWMIHIHFKLHLYETP